MGKQMSQWEDPLEQRLRGLEGSLSWAVIKRRALYFAFGIGRG